MVKICMGFMGGSVANSNILANATTSAEILDYLASRGVREIDTARVYGDGASESMLGQLSASSRFLVQTKAPAFSPGSLSRANIHRNCEASLSALKTDKFDIYYLHGPDTATPFTEQCEAINELYEAGKFTRFGVSNLRPSQVTEIVELCKARGWVRPTVYQGGYNPVARGPEKTLLPLLKSLGIAFYAFSPLAGGFLAKPLSEILEPKEGTRFAAMTVFGEIYCQPEFIEAVEQLRKILDKHDIAVRNATLRWFMHHSPLGDENAVVLGASSLAQAQQNVEDCLQGPLPDSVAAAMENLWTQIKDVKLPHQFED